MFPFLLHNVFSMISLVYYQLFVVGQSMNERMHLEFDGWAGTDFSFVIWTCYFSVSFPPWAFHLLCSGKCYVMPMFLYLPQSQPYWLWGVEGLSLLPMMLKLLEVLGLRRFLNPSSNFFLQTLAKPVWFPMYYRVFLLLRPQLPFPGPSGTVVFW